MRRVRVVTAESDGVKATITVRLETKRGGLTTWEVANLIDQLTDRAMQSMAVGSQYMAVPLSRMRVK